MKYFIFTFIFQFVFIIKTLGFTIPDDTLFKINNSFTLGVKLHYGLLIKHTKALQNLDDSYPYGIEADFSWHYCNKKAWDLCNCYPRLGFSCYFWNYGNPSQLGNGVITTGYVEPFFGFNKKFNFSLRAGAGFSFLSRPYDSINNLDNMAYGTKISFPLIIAANLNYKINDKFIINYSLNYNHISNGGIKQPNKGLNYPTMSVGLDYYFRNFNFIKREKTNWKELFPQRNHYYFSIFSAVKQIGHSDYKKYFIWGFYFKYSRQLARINALNISAELIDHGANKEILRRNYQSNTDHHRAGILLGHEFILGRFIFSQKFGVYCYDPSKLDDPVYQRYGLSFKISRRIFTEICLLSHRHIADFLDIRTGIHF